MLTGENLTICKQGRTMMSKVAIILPSLVGGGVERIRLALARKLAQEGYEVEFVLMRAEGMLLDEASKEFRIVDLKAPRVRALPAAFGKYLRDYRPQKILVAMWPLTFVVPAVVRILSPRCRVVVSEHGMLTEQYRGKGIFHRVFLRISTAIGYRLANERIGVSSGLVKDMAKISFMRECDFQVIYNPVAPRNMPSSTAVKAVETLWCCPPGGRILTVGTFKKVKNFHLLLRAFSQLSSEDTCLLLLGDGSDRESLVSLSHELGISDKVSLPGFHPDPSPFYMSADLFVLSSDFEGFGNVLVEALSFGLPIVATDAPSGPREILSGGEFGDLVPTRDPTKLQQAIDRALGSPVCTARLKKRAQHFNFNRVAQAYVEMLEG